MAGPQTTCPKTGALGVSVRWPNWTVRVLIALALITLAVETAHANAWTRPKGEMLFISAASIHGLDGRDDFSDLYRVKLESSIYAEFGLTDKVTLVGRAAWQSMTGFDQSGRSVSTQSGLGGLQAGVRYRLAQAGRWSMAAETQVGLPGSGENWNNARFGQGGGDIDIRLALGRSIGEAAFVTASSGWRGTPDGRPDEIRLDVASGFTVQERAKVMVQTYSVWSTGDGATNQSGYSGHRVQGSILFEINPRLQLQLSGLTTMVEDNMSRERALFFGIWRSF